MISMNKTYAENISHPDNSAYGSIVDQIFETGKFDDKFKLLMSSNDIANICYLIVINTCDKIGFDHKHKANNTEKNRKKCKKYSTQLNIFDDLLINFNMND